MSSAENPPSAAAIPWTYRWAVLALLSVSLFANYYLFDSLGMVADVVMREHKLSEVDYGLLSGAYNIAGALALLVEPEASVLHGAVLTADGGVRHGVL